MATGRFEGIEFGPAMAALPTDMQRAFVIALFALGTGHGASAAKAAGYAGRVGSSAWRVVGHNLLHDARIQAAMQEWGRTVLQLHNPAMVKNLVALANGAKGENIRLQATQDLLNRGGLATVMNVRHEHQHVVSFDDKLLELQRLARLAGDDPVLAIAGLAPQAVVEVTDAEYVDVSRETPPAEPEEDDPLAGAGSGWMRIRKVSDG